MVCEQQGHERYSRFHIRKYYHQHVNPKPIELSSFQYQFPSSSGLPNLEQIHLWFRLNWAHVRTRKSAAFTSFFNKKDLFGPWRWSCRVDEDGTTQATSLLLWLLQCHKFHKHPQWLTINGQMVWIPTIPKHWGLLVGLPHWSLNSIEPLEIDNRACTVRGQVPSVCGAMLLAKGFVAGYLLTCAILIVILFFPNRCAVDKTGIP